MLSFTALGTLYGDNTSRDTTAHITKGNRQMNLTYRRILGSKPWWFLETSATDTTVASQQAYDLPYDIDKLNTVYVTVSSTRYTPQEIVGRDAWDVLNSTTSVTSDIPEFFFIQEDTIEFYPTPSSASNTITYKYKKRVVDLEIADYTTGTITTLTNGGTGVVGNGTTWTVAMAGRYIKIDPDAGDGHWYKIASVTNTTTLVLDRAYQGTTVAAGSGTYTIGQIPILPENYHELIVLEPSYKYWNLQNNGVNRADRFKAQFDELLAQLLTDQGKKTTNVSVGTDTDYQIQNPNIFVTL